MGEENNQQKEASREEVRTLIQEELRERDKRSEKLEIREEIRSELRQERSVLVFETRDAVLNRMYLHLAFAGATIGILIFLLGSIYVRKWVSEEVQGRMVQPEIKSLSLNNSCLL